MNVNFPIKSMSLATALAISGLAVGAMPNPAQAQQRDRCNDYANQMMSFDQRARQLKCSVWNKPVYNYQQHYNWCDSKPVSVAEDGLSTWGSLFQRCQFQASGSPAAQPARPAAQPARPAPQQAGGLGCPSPGSVRSRNSNQPATIQFVNSSFQPLKIYWLDFQGQRKFYKELKHGQSYMQPTYLTHPWIAVDPNGSCFEPFQATTTGVNRMEVR